MTLASQMSILSTQTAKSTSHFSWIFVPMNNKLFVQAGISSAGWRPNPNGYEQQRDKVSLEIRRQIQAIKGMRLQNNLLINGIMGSSSLGSFQTRLVILWNGAHDMTVSIRGCWTLVWHVLQVLHVKQPCWHQVKDASWSLCMRVCSQHPSSAGSTGRKVTLDHKQQMRYVDLDCQNPRAQALSWMV